MIDLRSDTLTMPDRDMLETILSSAFGDAGRLDENFRGGDPTVNVLEDYASDLMGKEAAAFLCSGTMGNSAALLTWCRPGDKILIDRKNHTYRTEQFVFESRFGQIVPVFYETTPDGLPIPDSIEEHLKKDDIKVLQLENTHNAHGGICIPVSLHKKLYEMAHRYGAVIHVDGARILNAAIALGVSPAELGQYADSVMFCVSKGLGAPFGSIVCGAKTFIDQLRLTQKCLGGSLRQAGVMAAPALYALKNQVERLAEDNRHAAQAAAGLQGLVHIQVPEQVQTNIVMLTMSDIEPDKFCELLKEKGIIAGKADEAKVRLVFYKGITDADVETTVQNIRELDAQL